MVMRKLVTACVDVTLMKTRLAAAITILMASAATPLNCQAAIRGDRSKRSPQISHEAAVSNGVEIGTYVPVSSLAGKDIYMLVAVTNHSDKPVAYLVHGYKGYKTGRISVVDRTGASVPLTNFGLSIYPKYPSEDSGGGGQTISPRTTRDIRIPLSHIYNVGATGQYKVTAAIQILNGKSSWFRTT